MAISNLSSQYISSSFQSLLQVSSSNEVYNGSGTQITTLLVSASYATTSSYALNAAAGAQGPSGTQGTQGVQGRQGITGTQGTIGTSIQGTTGAPGTGIQGLQGETGIQGVDGFQGATGATGAGTQGTTGTNGAQGIQGSSTGTQGTTGAQGVQGILGTGVQGAAGSVSYYSNPYGILWDDAGNLQAATSPIQQTSGGPNGIWTGDMRGTIDLSSLGTATPGSGLVIPTSPPNNPVNGSMYVDLVGNRLKIWDVGTGAFRNINII